MVRKIQYIYKSKVQKDKIADHLNKVASDKYASHIDLDLTYEIGIYMTRILKRFNNQRELERRPEFTIPLKHAVEVIKELSLMLNSYIMEPPQKPEAHRYDFSLLIFRDSLEILRIMQNYLDEKMEEALDVMIKDRDFNDWEDYEKFCEASITDISSKGDIIFKKHPKLKEWEMQHKKGKKKK